MSVELNPTGWFRGNLEATVDGRGAITITIARRGWCGDSAEFRLDGRSYRLKSSGFGHREYAVLQGTRTLARAKPRGFFGTAYQISLVGAPQPWKRLRLEREGWSGWRHALFADDRVVGRMRSEGFFQRRDVLELEIPLLIEQALFRALVRRLVQEARQYVAVT